MAKRSYGSGSLYVRQDAAGRESWYGHWRQDGRQVKRRIGPKRAAGSREGLTRTQAERELQRRIETTQVKPRVTGDRKTVGEVASTYIAHAERRGRKRSTCANIESEVRVHLEPVLGGRSLDSIKPEHIVDLIATLEGKGLSPKSIRNVVATLSALFNFAKHPRRRWAAENPCEGLDLPAIPEQTEIRYLTLEEVDAVVAAARPGMYQAIDRALYLTAAMTGLRKGELVALRWRDVDWPAARIRVRQNYVRGEFGTPKSKRSTRSVPMAKRSAASWSGCSRRRASRATATSCSPTRPLASRCQRRTSRAGSARRSRRRASTTRTASTTCATPSGRGWRRLASPDADAAGVDGPPRPRHHADLRRLRAERRRGADDRACIRPR